MTIARVINTPYDLQTWVGDSGTLTIRGLPTDADNYVLFVEIHGKQKVVKEFPLDGADELTIDFTVEDTEALGAGQWPYGIKIVQGNTENTLVPSLKIGGKATFIVNKKVVEGTINAND